MLSTILNTTFSLAPATATPASNSIATKAASSASKNSDKGKASTPSSSSKAQKPEGAKPEKLVDGYFLRQECQAGGLFDVKACTQGLRLDSHAGIEYLFRPKEDVVAVCNHGSKVYWSGPLANWKPPMQKASYFRRSSYADLQLEKTESQTFMGVAVNKQTLKSKQQYRKNDHLTPEEKQELTGAEIITTSAIVDNLKPLSQALSLVYAVPVPEGLPLQVVYTNRKGATRRDLRTLELMKSKVKLSEFLIPPGYTRLEKVEDAYGGSADSLKEMLEGLTGGH